MHDSVLCLFSMCNIFCQVSNDLFFYCTIVNAATATTTITTSLLLLVLDLCSELVS